MATNKEKRRAIIGNMQSGLFKSGKAYNGKRIDTRLALDMATQFVNRLESNGLLDSYYSNLEDHDYRIRGNDPITDFYEVTQSKPVETKDLIEDPEEANIFNEVKWKVKEDITLSDLITPEYDFAPKESLKNDMFSYVYDKQENDMHYGPKHNTKNEKLQKFNPEMDDRKFDESAQEYYKGQEKEYQEKNDKDFKRKDFIREKISENLTIAINRLNASKIKYEDMYDEDEITEKWKRNDWSDFFPTAKQMVAPPKERPKVNKDLISKKIDVKKLEKLLRKEYGV